MSHLVTSVKDFFLLCNWENKPSKTVEQIKFSEWRTLSVEHFFSRTNWAGIEQQPEDKQVKNPEIFSVEEFFNSCNWSGKINRISEQNELKKLSLTISVSEFFLNIKWEKAAEIAKIVEKPSNLESKIKKKDDFSLNDLSDLF